MSTQRIEAQIEQICLGIERHKDVLKRLESSKSLLQQQPNAARDPVARLPVEIASEIFLQCLPPPSEYPREYPQPQARHAPQLFLNVCHNWTNIALSTPALWASIGIILPSTSAFESLSEMWLRRAGNHLLNISLGGVFDSLVAHPIQSHFAQLESLAIWSHQTNDLGGIQSQIELPSLQELEVIGPGYGTGTVRSGLSFHQFLRCCSNLVELHMRQLTFVEFDEEPATLVFNHLRNLTYINNSGAIAWITAPALEILASSADDLSERPFTSFLRRSSPPIRKLRLTQEVNFYRFGEFMPLLPTLAHLECSNVTSELVARLLEFLAQSPGLVPNLRTLGIVLNCDTVRSYSLGSDSLVPVLSVRQGTLQTVRLTMSQSNRFLLDRHDRAVFQRFVADGMDIHIGVLDGPNLVWFSEPQEELDEGDEDEDEESAEESDDEESDTPRVHSLKFYQDGF